MSYFPPQYKDRKLLEKAAKSARERGLFTDREYDVLQYRLPFEGFSFESIERVAKILNLTRLRIRNLQDKASRKLLFYVNHPELY